MGVIRINQLPDGSGSLSNDDVMLFMDNPSNGGITKQISFGSVKLNTISSPSTLSSDQNNYSLPSGADIVRLSSSISINITGLVAGQNGQGFVIINTGTSEITFKHLSSSSSVNNRIICPGQVDYIVNRNGGAMTVLYDNIDSKWRIL